MKNQFRIHPSQLDSFKVAASTFAQFIAEESNSKQLSSFKRLDWLSQSIGYKCHSDMKILAEGKIQSDKFRKLSLFSEDSIRSSIVKTFSTRLPGIDSALIARAAEKMRDLEIVQLNTTLTLKGTGWSVEQVFDDENIERHIETASGYTFWMKGISIPIQVSLQTRPHIGDVSYSLSHYIFTPSQMSAYIPSNQSGDYLAYALERAVSSITQFYEIAIGEGHRPNDDWLVLNDIFPNVM